MTEERKTIYDAVLELCAAFEREGLAPPVAIELADPREGHRLLDVAARDRPSFVAMTEADLWSPPRNECEIMGVKVRWPRGYFLREDGTLGRPGAREET